MAESPHSPRGLCAALGALLLLAGCGQNAGTGGAPGEMVFHRGNGAEPQSLDPHYAQGNWEDAIVGDLIIGLTTYDAQGNAIPGAAESWEVSDDGLTLTFHLREHSWSDGVPVTAEDFVYAWRRILDPLTAASYAYYLYPIKNAEAVNNGEMPGTALGITATDEQTLVVELEYLVPYFVEYMTHFTTFPVPKHVVETHGNAWGRPGNYVSNGPYTLAEWVPNDRVVLVRNPLFYDAENVRIDRVIFYPSSDYEAALRRFRAGELDVQSRLPTTQIDWLRENMPEVLDIRPVLVIEYYAMNRTREPFDDVRVREALSLALDRETITEQIVRVGNPPAYSIVPPGIANYPGTAELTFKDMPYPERVARAQMLIREAGFGPDNRLRTTLAVRSASAEARRIPAAVQQMWRDIYVDVEIVQSDAAVFYNSVQEHDFDIAIAGWVADFNDASNFLDLLRTGNSNNYGLYSNPEYDALLDQAKVEQNLEARGELLAQAEVIALEDHAWIPASFGVSTSLVHTYVEGWTNNVNDIHRTRWLSIDTEERTAAMAR